MAPSDSTLTTSFLLANLHCPTCVSAIKDVLQELPGIRWVSPNVVTSWVTVEHDSAVSISQMASRLESAGFEVSSIASNDSDEGQASSLRRDTATSPGETQSSPNSEDMGELESALHCISKISGKLTHAQAAAAKAEKEKTHLNNCEQCRVKGPRPAGLCSGSTLDRSNDITNDKLGDEKTGRGLVLSTKSLVAQDDKPVAAKPWRASFALEGLTCASCVNSTLERLDREPWITKATVNLASLSAVVEYIGAEDDVDRIIDAIDSIGFGAHLDEVVSIEDEKQTPAQERTVEIRIDGFYCQHCADRATNSLAGFRRDVSVVSRPTMSWPVLKITYIPEVPNFTIRRILAAIEASDPAFKASIHHPLSLEERTKRVHASHQRQLLIRAIFTFIVAIPTFIIGIVYMSLVDAHDNTRMFLMEPWSSGISRAQIALCIMATPVYFLAADIFHRRAVKEIKSLWRRSSLTPILQRFYRFGSMNMLISLGTTIAYVSSISQMLVAAADRPAHVKDTNFYFDSVVFLTLFLLVGRLIEAYSKSKTGDAVEALGKLRPTTAILVENDGGEKQTDSVVATDLLEFGDTVRIPHGASPPCDGKVVQGETQFDESSLTGESRLIRKSTGDDVFAGTVNKDAPILIRITGVAGKSILDQIVSIVREGQTKRAPMEKVADLLTAYFVPVVTLVAVLTWLIWLSLGVSGALPEHFLDVSSGGWVAFSLQFAIAVFVVACPCGLALAAPTAIFVGGGLAAKHGILVKGGGEAFEKASRVDCVVFDKTGTLTEGGEPSITNASLFPEQDVSEEQRSSFLAALQAVEENSSHPIAKAIVSFCKSNAAQGAATVSDVEELPGKGLRATCTSRSPEQSFDLIIGNEALMHDFSVSISSTVATDLQTWKTEAKSVALAAIKPTPSSADAPRSYTLAAALAISDPVRPETAAVIQALRARGTDVWMLSGDNATTARAVALRVGIAEGNVIAEVLPAEKHDRIKYLQSTLKARVGRNQESTTRRATVAMVGDGINDAPALSAADVGVAVGSGSDVAIASADFVLVGGCSLAGIVALLDLSAAVFARIKLNFAWALVYNVLAVPVAAGCLYALEVHGQHVRLDPVWASLAMALSSISVVLSSLALRCRVPGIGFRIRKVWEARE
ncbi:heavy metal translocatin [Xylariaceae sp. FL0662B]|nr:heavy metal translocatin [Xylariaceae sp. FL0662B]